MIGKYIEEVELSSRSRGFIDKKIEEINENPFERFELVYMGIPKPSPRPRIRIIWGKLYQRIKKSRKFNDFAYLYDPSTKIKKKIKKSFKEQLDDDYEIITGEVKVNLRIFREIPKGFSAVQRYLAEKGIFRPTVKPDIDNYEKTVLDAMSGLIWKDDGQVTESNTIKLYSIKPRVEIEVLHRNYKVYK